MQEKTFTVAEVVQAIIDYFEGDWRRVRDFYRVADAKLHFASPLTDAILDEIDRWLMQFTFARSNMTADDVLKGLETGEWVEYDL
jgi:hypothetical protein